MSLGENKLDLSLKGNIDVSDHYSDRWILWIRNWVRTVNPESQFTAKSWAVPRAVWPAGRWR